MHGHDQPAAEKQGRYGRSPRAGMDGDESIAGTRLRDHLPGEPRIDDELGRAPYIAHDQATGVQPSRPGGRAGEHRDVQAKRRIGLGDATRIGLHPSLFRSVAARNHPYGVGQGAPPSRSRSGSVLLRPSAPPRSLLPALQPVFTRSRRPRPSSRNRRAAPFQSQRSR